MVLMEVPRVVMIRANAFLQLEFSKTYSMFCILFMSYGNKILLLCPDVNIASLRGHYNLSNFEDGVLSSSFMVGLLIASPVFASLAKRLEKLFISVSLPLLMPKQD